MSWGRKKSGPKSIKISLPHISTISRTFLSSLSLSLSPPPPPATSTFTIGLTIIISTTRSSPTTSRGECTTSLSLSLPFINFIFFLPSNWCWLSFSPPDSCRPSSQAISYTAPMPGNLPFPLFSSSTTCGGVAACRMIIHSACSVNYNSRGRWAGPTTTWASGWTCFGPT